MLKGDISAATGDSARQVEPSFWNWPFLPSNTLAVAGWGFWLAIIGLILTLAGFWITLRQLNKTKSASEAVKQEVERIRGSLDAYDAAHEASRAQYALKTVRRNLHNNLWAEVIISYEDVRNSLVILKSTSNLLSKDQLDQIDSAITYIHRLCERIEGDLQKKANSISAVKTSAVIRQHDQLLVDINITLQRGRI
ncbi:hypothetical protein [Sphingobium tyrosinilyticum]|uniref:Uncharacterized protein n=1 Tax=Sphingobium tyrosinilyticum TaxID=2715436 RepID=A0ABV9EWR3_9SPHN